MIVKKENIQFIILSTSLIVFCASLYFQYIEQLQPCPLCIMQRLAAFALVFLAFLTVIPRFKKRISRVSIGQALVACAGVFFAGRQLWLQSLPPGQTPACLPGLDILLRYFSWQDVLHALFWGSGDCAENNWQWLGLTMPAWAGIYFITVLVLSIYCWRVAPKRS